MGRARAAYSVAPLWEPLTVLPSQFTRSKVHRSCPEMHMVAAIFDDALQCVLRNADARSGQRLQAFRGAWDWFWDDTRDWPFACANVCDLLALDIAAVRQCVQDLVTGIRRARVADASATERRRRWDGLREVPRPLQRCDAPRLSPGERFEMLGWDEV